MHHDSYFCCLSSHFILFAGEQPNLQNADFPGAAFSAQTAEKAAPGTFIFLNSGPNDRK